MRSSRADHETDERAADLALRAHFARIARPGLSPFFEPRLRARLREEHARAIDNRARWLLRLYWLAAGGATLLVLARTAWPETLPTDVALIALVCVVLTGFALMLLGRLRGGLFELVLRLLP